MCGITLIRHFDGTAVNLQDLRRAASTIKHRGPDQAGYALTDNNTLGLAHLRLAIQDPSAPPQPLWSPTGDLAIIFNGEAYDFHALRTELEAAGRAFATRTDTEVVLALYERYGVSDDFWARLNGEFAFAIWDARTRELVLGRDRFGVRPLFWWAAEDGRSFAAGSEAKAILAMPMVPRAFDKEAVWDALHSVALHVSYFKGINKVKPAHYMVVSADGKIASKAYWVPKIQKKFTTDISFEDAKAELRTLMHEAVARRFVADVPVCVYLSGGLDSTIVASIAARLGTRVKCFNIDFGPDFPMNETALAAATAAHYGLPFEAVPVPLAALAATFVKTILHAEIVSDFNPHGAAKLLLAAHVKAQGYAVALTGEGGDEVFAGYPWQKVDAVLDIWAAGDAPRAQAIAARIRARDPLHGVWWELPALAAVPRAHGHPSQFEHHTRKVDGALRALVRAPPARVPSYIPLIPDAFVTGANDTEALRISVLRTQIHMESYVLTMLGDRPEMAHAVEGRPPFLDVRVAEFANRVPAAFLLDVDAAREKHIVYEAFRDELPPGVYDRVKQSFVSPSLGEIMRRTPEGTAMRSTYLTEEAIEAAGVFEPGPTLAMVGRWIDGGEKSVELIGSMVLSLQILWQELVRNPPPSDPDFEMREMGPPVVQ